MSNITLNIVEPGSTPVDPVVPNTGLFTSGIGGAETAIIATASLVAILAIIIAVLYYRNKKQGKLISLKHSKATTTGLTTLALLVSIGTVAGLLRLGASAADDSLTITTSSTDFTIEVGDEPVFAVLPVELTVAEATEAGYTLTAYTEDTSLISTADESKVIPMVVADEGELTTLTDNTYGLALIAPEDKDSEVYTTLSTEINTPTLITNKDYKATEENDTTTIYYGFYITPDVPYGTYEGSNINYQANPNYITTLAFNGNGSDGGVDMEGMTILAGDTITLPQNTYTKEGYTFTGWNTVATPTTEDPGIAYANEADFTASLTQSEDITLYAQWKALPVISDLTYMQDFATLSTEEKSSVLSSMTENQQYQLKDNRDQTVYYIAKLADGHVWMTQNLDLDLSTETTLTPANTNITENWKPASSTIAKDDLSSDTWQDDNNSPYSYDPGDVYYYTSGNNDNDTATDKATCEQAHQDGSCAHYHAGNYYNWSAAVANNNTEGITEKYTNVDTSICPAGWRLPKNANAESYIEGNEQITEISSYDGILGEYSPYGPPGGMYSYLEGGFNAIRTAPLWLARSGFVGGGSLSRAGSNGSYWSSTVDSSSRAFNLYFDSGNVYPASSNGRSNGYSVRCIAQ